jgi:transcriptional regulator with XRE-family HTH domain
MAQTLVLTRKAMTIEHLALLQAIRAKTGDSQARLAERIGISQVTVGRWLRGVDAPAHNQRMKIELVARHLGVLKDLGDGKGAPIVGFIQPDGSIRWADNSGKEMATSGLSGLVALVYEGPPSLDGFIQPGCEVWFDTVRVQPDETHFGKPCIAFGDEEEIAPYVGVLRRAVSKRSRTYEMQMIGSGALRTVRITSIAMVRQIHPPA